MKKISIIFLCLLAGTLIYCLWPEYGSGYPEQQRRLWNERRTIYPISWMLNGSTPYQDFLGSCSGIAKMTGKTEKEVQSLIKKKKGQGEAIARELEVNRDREEIDYQVKEPVSVDISRLPLYGLTKREIAERALAGEGDACLMMVQNLCYGTSWYGFAELGWNETHEVKKWLDMAAAAKRPGSEFLKNLLAEAGSFLKTRIKDDYNKVSTGEYKTVKIQGYDEFVECLKKGDYVLYKTASRFLTDEDLIQERKLIYDALLKGAGEGRKECQRDFALLFFEDGVFQWNNTFPYLVIERDIEEKIRNWDKALKWLPASWNKKVTEGLFACGLIGAEGTRTLETYRVASRFARKAAIQGDMTAMYLWVMYGITCEERFSVEEWSDILSYSRILFEAGYVPYIEEIKSGKGKWGDRELLAYAILSSYYSKKSYEAIRKKDYLAARQLLKEFSRDDSLEEVRENIRNFCQIGRRDDVLDAYFIEMDEGKGGLIASVPEEVRDYLVKQLAQWAEEGDINPMYRLAEVYKKGIGVSPDPERAYALYKEALKGAEEYPRFITSIRDDGAPYSSIGLRHVIRLRMAEMVLAHPEFPEREKKEIYDLVLDSYGIWQIQVYYYAVLGRFNEFGIGRPVDREKALEFYRKGVPRNKKCQAGIDRLTSDSKEKDKE